MKLYCESCRKVEEIYEISVKERIYHDNKKYEIEKKINKCCNCDETIDR